MVCDKEVVYSMQKMGEVIFEQQRVKRCNRKSRQSGELEKVYYHN